MSPESATSGAAMAMLRRSFALHLIFHRQLDFCHNFWGNLVLSSLIVWPEALQYFYRLLPIRLKPIKLLMISLKIRLKLTFQV